jgi:hypothetical protein
MRNCVCESRLEEIKGPLHYFGLVSDSRRALSRLPKTEGGEERAEATWILMNNNCRAITPLAIYDEGQIDDPGALQLWDNYNVDIVEPCNQTLPSGKFNRQSINASILCVGFDNDRLREIRDQYTARENIIARVSICGEADHPGSKNHQTSPLIRAKVFLSGHSHGTHRSLPANVYR